MQVFELLLNSFTLIYLLVFLFRCVRPSAECYRHCRADRVRCQHSLWFLCWSRYFVTAGHHRLSDITTGKIRKDLNNHWVSHSLWSWSVWILCLIIITDVLTKRFSFRPNNYVCVEVNVQFYICNKTLHLMIALSVFINKTACSWYTNEKRFYKLFYHV